MSINELRRERDLTKQLLDHYRKTKNESGIQKCQSDLNDIGIQIIILKNKEEQHVN